MVAGGGSEQRTLALLNEVRNHFLPRTVLLLADGGDDQRFLGETNISLSAMKPVNGKPAVYVCENFTCRAPTTDPRELAQILMQRE